MNTFAQTRSLTATEMARRLIDRGSTSLADLSGPVDLDLAWALKDECVAAWSSEPQRSVQAADLLRMLCARAVGRPQTSTNPQTRELRALADWGTAIAQLTQGQMTQAEHSLDAAAAGFRGLGQAAHAAQTQVPKIMALAMLGRYDEAAACAELAQQSFLALGDKLGAGKVSINLGALHVQRADFAQAAIHSRKAAVWFARVGDHEHSVMADINLASALTSLGDFDEAQRIYARAHMRAVQHRFPVLQALVDMSAGLLRLARGQYREALAGFEAARRQYEVLNHPQNLAIAEKQLADTYLELRMLPEAAALYEQVLRRFRSLDMRCEEAWTLAQCGRAQALQMQHALATVSFERAAALFAAQANAVGEASVTLARAEVALAKYDAGQATAFAMQAAQGFQAAGLPGGQLLADVVRAHALLQAGSVEQARSLFNATLACAEALQLLGVQVRCLTGRGLTAQAMDDTAAAQRAFDAAIELFEDQRNALPSDELRSAFLSDHLLPYQGRLRLALQDHSHAPSLAHAHAVLQQLERVRARTLGERIRSHQTQHPDDATQALRERLNWLHCQVQRQQEEGKSVDSHIDELHRTEHALLEGVRRTRLSSAADAACTTLRRADDALDIQALQAALGAHDLLIEYGVQDDELFAVIVSADGAQLLRRVASWQQVQDGVRATRFQIEALRHGASVLQQHLHSLTERTQLRLARLHDLVWAPLVPLLTQHQAKARATPPATASAARSVANSVADSVADSVASSAADSVSHLGPRAPCRQRLLLVPHGPLGWLPFAALHDGHTPLSERFELALVPSAKMALRGLQRPTNPPVRALVLGECSRLPHAAEEARNVGRMFTNAQVLVAEQATLRHLCQHAPQADVIHLACHAQFRNDNPMFSALHLLDGALSVEQIEALSLQAATVVLSGCDTGLADQSAGDERVGLVRAFLLAGASRVVASQWTVDDEITSHFMGHFYGALRAGQTPAAALRLAQLELKQHHPHPFYWAAFTLHGGW
jgi:CHAT domain-containing protein